MPLLILVFNNAKYAAMQYYHDKFYPTGTAIAAEDYYGVELRGVKYELAATMVEAMPPRGNTRRTEEALDKRSNHWPQAKARSST